MERTNKDFKTSGGHAIVLRSFATGKDFAEIQQVYLEGAKVNMVAGAVAVEGFNAGADFKAKEKAIELLVVSVDGVTEGIVEAVMGLPYEEVAEIQAELEMLTSKKKTA